jgi:hypothetical protein
MKMKFLFLLAGLILFSISVTFAQPKTEKEVRKEAMAKSVKNFRTVLTRLYGNARLNPKPTKSCSKDAIAFLKGIDKKTLIPTDKDLEKEINTILDSLDAEIKVDYAFNSRITTFKAFIESKSYPDFVFKLTGRDIGDLETSELGKKRLKLINDFYRRLKRLLKQPFTVFKKSFKKGKCVYKVETKLQLTQLKYMFKKNTNALTANWDIESKIRIDCPCTAADPSKFKNAVFVYKSKSVGPIYTTRYNRSKKYTLGFLIVPYGLVIGAMEKPKLYAQQIICCTGVSGIPEDSNYTEVPEKEINYRETWIDGGMGISFGTDEPTLFTGSGGVFFKVGTLAENGLYLGGKINATTPLGEDEISEIRITVGPAAEYHIPIGVNRIQILTGVQAGYTFGSVEAFGFKDNISGFSGTVYSGVEVPVNDNLALGILLSLFDYSNLTFKAENNEFESSASNSVFIFDRPSLSVNLRVNLK